MPIYEYRCQACGHKLEAIQKVSDASLTDCPECQQPALSKLVSAAGFRLKGGGWYETDFKSDNKRNLASSADGKDAAKSDAKGDKKADGKAKSAESAKPAAKVESKSGGKSSGSGSSASTS